MPTTPKPPTEIALAFAQAINSRGMEDIAALMTADHVFIDSLGNRVQGKEKMKSGWAGYFRMVPDYSITIHESFASGDIVVMLGTAQGTFAGSGELLPENRWSTPAAFRARVHDSLVAEWRVYADNEPLRQLMNRKK
jgi:ketosteroid isomerase-like protein